jgi:hypothetical protein
MPPLPLIRRLRIQRKGRKTTRWRRGRRQAALFFLKLEGGGEKEEEGGEGGGVTRGGGQECGESRGMEMREARRLLFVVFRNLGFLKLAVRRRANIFGVSAALALHIASTRGHTEAVKTLLRPEHRADFFGVFAGALVNAADEDGMLGGEWGGVKGGGGEGGEKEGVGGGEDIDLMSEEESGGGGVTLWGGGGAAAGAGVWDRVEEDESSAHR